MLCDRLQICPDEDRELRGDSGEAFGVEPVHPIQFGLDVGAHGIGHVADEYQSRPVAVVEAVWRGRGEDVRTVRPELVVEIVDRDAERRLEGLAPPFRGGHGLPVADMRLVLRDPAGIGGGRRAAGLLRFPRFGVDSEPLRRQRAQRVGRPSLGVEQPAVREVVKRRDHVQRVQPPHRALPVPRPVPSALEEQAPRVRGLPLDQPCGRGTALGGVLQDMGVLVRDRATDQRAVHGVATDADQACGGVCRDVETGMDTHRELRRDDAVALGEERQHVGGLRADLRLPPLRHVADELERRAPHARLPPARARGQLDRESRRRGGGRAACSSRPARRGGSARSLPPPRSSARPRPTPRRSGASASAAGMPSRPVQPTMLRPARSSRSTPSGGASRVHSAGASPPTMSHRPMPVVSRVSPPRRTLRGRARRSRCASASHADTSSSSGTASKIACTGASGPSHAAMFHPGCSTVATAGGSSAAALGAARTARTTAAATAAMTDLGARRTCMPAGYGTA